MLKCVQRSSSICRVFIHTEGKRSSTPRLSDFSFDSVSALSCLVSDLPLLSRNYALSGHRILASDLFHSPYQPHYPRGGYRAFDSRNLLPRHKDGLCSAPQNCAGHIAFVVLRVNHRRHRLPYALSDLSVVRQNWSSCSGSLSHVRRFRWPTQRPKFLRG